MAIAAECRVSAERGQIHPGGLHGRHIAAPSARSVHTATGRSREVARALITRGRKNPFMPIYRPADQEA